MYHRLEQNHAFIPETLPRNTNLVNFSIFNDLSQPITFRSFSIKYVIEGRENYQVNGNRYALKTGDYLLANPHCAGRVEIDSAFPVKGICIDLAPDMLSEVLSGYVDPDNTDAGNVLDHFFYSSEFLENQYASTHTRLGEKLNHLGQILRCNPYADYTFEKEFYFALAERVVSDQSELVKQIGRITHIKATTRKDLYRKAIRAKAYIDAHYTGKIFVPEVAAEVLMSEYHFYRIFKMVFQISPQQYLIRKRLEKATALLSQGKLPVTEVAFQSGFSDLYTFSATFKKHFGVSPSDFGNRKSRI